MKRFLQILTCLLVFLSISQVSWAEEVPWLSPEAKKSIRGLNLRLPAYLPEGVAPAQPRIYPPPDEAAPWPTIDWSVSTPEEQGMDRDILINSFRYAVANKSKAVVVIRNGYIVGEWYDDDWNEETMQTGFSMAKSFSSAVVGMLIDDGLINSVGQKVAGFVPEWYDLQHWGVSVENLLSMNSGVYFNFFSDYVILTTRPDQSAFAVGLPMEAFPGSKWIYNNSACQVISELVLQASGMQTADYARARIWNKIGMWNATWMTDQVGNTLTYQSVFASAREFAKFGYLYLRGGEWDGEQIVSRDWVIRSTQPSQWLNPFYGYLWWLNTWKQMWPDAPADAYAAIGMGEKRIYVIPSLDIVAVRLGEGRLLWSDNDFLGPICDSVLPRIDSE